MTEQVLHGCRNAPHAAGSGWAEDFGRMKLHEPGQEWAEQFDVNPVRA